MGLETSILNALQTDEGESWVEEEMGGCQFSDKRLGKRATIMIKDISAKIGESIPIASQDWASTQAAYRFVGNESVSPEDILGGHFLATRQRIAATSGPVLILHDTTEFVSGSKSPDMGFLQHSVIGRTSKGGSSEIAVRGVAMHSSLALTPEGLPLGLTAAKLWTREKSEESDSSKKKKKWELALVPIEEKESFRWLENLTEVTELLGATESCVHIGDRESDIFEFFVIAEELKTHFLLRSNSDRVTSEDGKAISLVMEDEPVRGEHQIELTDRHGKKHQTILELKFRQIEVPPPSGKKRQYSPIAMTVIHAIERGEPEGRERIEWKLLTNLPAKTLSQAVEKLNWYAMRWKIEVFHKILKSGCKAEDSKLRTSERLTNFVALCCIVAWRVFWLTMLRRTAPEAPACVALTETEIKILDVAVKPLPRETQSTSKTVSDCILKLARLGGYLARAGDPPPGNLVIWRGLSRLNDLHLGYLLGRKDVCN
jgi:hypothetical protein